MNTDVFPFRRIFNLVERLDRVVEHAGDEVRREHLNPVVEVAHSAVVIFAGVGDVFFDLFQLVLQVDEIGVGLEIRVGFGHGEEVGQGLVDLVFAGNFCVEVVRGNRRRVVAGGDHLAQGVLFVARVALHRFHEIRDQVVAFFEIDVHGGEGFFHLVVQPDEAVFRGDDPDENHRDDDDNDNGDQHVNTSLFLLVLYHDTRALTRRGRGLKIKSV